MQAFANTRVDLRDIFNAGEMSSLAGLLAEARGVGERIASSKQQFFRTLRESIGVRLAELYLPATSVT
jgi:hypothetical protein